LEKSIEIETHRYRHLLLDIYKSVDGFFIDSFGNRKSNVLTANFFASISAMLNRASILLENYVGNVVLAVMENYPRIFKHFYKNEPIQCGFTSQRISGHSEVNVSVFLKAETNYRTIVVQSNAPINFQQVRTAIAGDVIVGQCLSAIGSAGTLFSSFIEFKKPFTNNLPRIIHDATRGSYTQYPNIFGNMFIPRSSSPQIAGPSEIVVDIDVSNKEHPYSEDDAFFANPLVLSTASNNYSYYNAPSAYIAIASLSPSSRIYINSFGLCQRVYNTANQEQRIVWIKKNISPPREVTPSKPFLVTIRFYGL
ncbi:MAG: hypothetical protein QXU27_01810, partial [Candidatus Anstonellales archaeon]